MAIKSSKQMLAAHSAGIFADMTLDGPEIGTLVAVIDRAKNLPNRKTMGKQNPYCAMRLGKEAKKTGTDKRGGQTPKWDQELRFIVHESPDYYKLKCSVFNDDKRTDLIGESWINLADLIKPGGGSNDLWHQLNYKGKYAGDIRIELTYYDMRPREEKTQEKRRVREKVPSPSTDVGNAVSGPRQLGPRDVRRRPLPSSPATASPQHTSPASTPQDEAPPRPPKIPHNHHTIQQLPATHPQQPPFHPQAQENSYDFDPYNSEIPAVQPVTQQQYRQPYYEEQPHASDIEGLDSFGFAAEHDEEHTYADPGHQMVLRPNPSTLPQPAWSDETPMWDQSQKRRSQHYSIPDNTFQSSTRSLPNPPIQSSPNHHHSPRSNTTPVTSGSYRDHPLRHSMNQHDVPVDMVHKPDPYNEPPPPPPKHRDTTPRRQQPEYPPSAFVHHDSSQASYNSHSNRSTPRRLSVDERSPLQMIERELDPFIDPHAASNQSAKRQSYCEPYYEETDDRRQSHTVDNELLIPQRHSSYDAYHDADFNRASSGGYRQEDCHQPSQPQSIRRPQHRVRSGSYDDRYSMPGPPQQSNPLQKLLPPSSSQPDLPATAYYRPQPVRPRPQHQTQTPPRKAVSSGPYPEHLTRRLSDNPFGPDAYDVLNPASSPITNENTIFQTPEQAKEANRIRLSEGIREDEPIIGNDGRVIDPSDHLPSDTWAPEPEKKHRKPEHVIHYRTKNDVRPYGAPNSAPASVRASHQTRQRQYQGMPVPSPSSETPPSVRNRLQKIPSPSRPLPHQPYQMSRAEPSPPANPVNQQALQRYSYHETSPTVHRPALSEYQVPVSYDHTERRLSYRDDHGPSPQPQFNMHTGHDSNPAYANSYHNSLAAEMSMIDIGPSPNSRAMVRSNQRY